MKLTRIFAHNGRVGIEAGDKFINDPTQPGQLGCIVDLKYVVISREALDVLKKVKKSHDAIGDVMCWQCDDGMQCFGWMGGMKYLLHTNADADRDYNPSLLESRVQQVDAPEDFIKVLKKSKERTI